MAWYDGCCSIISDLWAFKEMSEKFKLKYEVIAILKENIQLGLESFGIPVTQNPGDEGWLVVESEQPSFRNADNAVLFHLEKTERIGWQGDRRIYNRDTQKYDVVDYFIEQQIWKIKVVCKRTTKPVSEDDVPAIAEDVTSMLIAWFNRLGCIEFRKHNMANLFIQMKDVRTYKDKSDVSQWTTEFPLKLQVIKQFETELDTATPVYGGAIPIEGNTEEAGRKDAGVKVQTSGLLGRMASRIKGVLFTNRH